MRALPRGVKRGLPIVVAASVGLMVAVSGRAAHGASPGPDPAITVAAGAGGSVSIADATTADACIGDTCGATGGDAMTLTATAEAGFIFAGWSGGQCAGQGALLQLFRLRRRDGHSVVHGDRHGHGREGAGLPGVDRRRDEPEETAREAPARHPPATA